MKLFWDAARYELETRVARAVQQQVGGDAVVICIDLADPQEGIAAQIAARRDGVEQILCPILADPLESVTKSIYANILAQPEEARSQLLDNLPSGNISVNGQPLSSITPAETTVRSAYTSFRLADYVLLSSFEQKKRWERLLNFEIRRWLAYPWDSAADATPLPKRGRKIVLHAPGMSEASVAFYRAALEHFPGVSISTDDVPAARVFDDAGVAILTDWHRGLEAVRCAEAGIRVLSPFASGASERGYAFGYDPLSRRSLVRTLDAALSASAAPRLPMAADDALATIRRSAIEPFDGPLVSVIVRTFNRPDWLRRALESIAMQSYRNVEAVVVNDGGDDIGYVCGEFEGRLHVRRVRNTEDRGLVVASNHGVEAAAGEYIAYLDDDDRFYPDHLLRAMYALQNSGASFAYTNCVGEYSEREDGAFKVREYAIFTDHDFDRDAFYVGNLTAIHSIVHRKDVFERLGPFDEKLAIVDDWDMWLRASIAYEFIHVDRVTCEYSWRFDPAAPNMTLNTQRKFESAYGQVYAKYRDALAARPGILARQAAELQSIRSRAAALEEDSSAARRIFGPPRPPGERL